MNCNRCNGNGEMDCPVCGGRGYDALGQPCADCGGIGHQPCAHCSGSGWLE